MNDNYDERDDELVAMAGKLSLEVAPKRDLWPDIEAAITTPQRSRWTPMFAQAAAVVLLVAGSSGVTYLAVTEQHENERVPTQVVPANMLFEETSFGGKYTLGSGFQDARGNLASKLDQELARAREVPVDVIASGEALPGLDAARSNRAALPAGGESMGPTSWRS